MKLSTFIITKRNGSRDSFSLDKISDAIAKAFVSVQRPVDIETISKVLTTTNRMSLAQRGTINRGYTLATETEKLNKDNTYAYAHAANNFYIGVLNNAISRESKHESDGFESYSSHHYKSGYTVSSCIDTEYPEQAYERYEGGTQITSGIRHHMVEPEILQRQNEEPDASQCHCKNPGRDGCGHIYHEERFFCSYPVCPVSADGYSFIWNVMYDIGLVGRVPEKRKDGKPIFTVEEHVPRLEDFQEIQRYRENQDRMGKCKIKDVQGT